MIGSGKAGGVGRTYQHADVSRRSDHDEIPNDSHTVVRDTFDASLTWRPEPFFRRSGG
jgi:hypothetical protein